MGYYVSRIFRLGVSEPEGGMGHLEVRCPSCAFRLDIEFLLKPRDCTECANCGARLEVLQEASTTIRLLAGLENEEYTYLGPVREIPIHSAKVFRVGNRDIAVFRTPEECFALKNQCPHHGFDLHTGQLENGMIRCSGHGFRFDLRSGKCDRNPALIASTYDLKIQGDELFVRLS
jgi:nitrite reductase/ring-hydroxylating ferredoxin subunit/DNA-directed RNA polymerase subunit RPC12/RpoP